jgi:hypothetical protein
MSDFDYTAEHEAVLRAAADRRLRISFILGVTHSLALMCGILAGLCLPVAACYGLLEVLS